MRDPIKLTQFHHRKKGDLQLTEVEVKKFLQAKNNNHKIEREKENNDNEDINNLKQESSRKSNNKKEKQEHTRFIINQLKIKVQL